MSPRKSVQQELTREMIMEAARDLFVKKGYQHVSMRQIAKELDYSHGAIYYHFKNKAELFYAMVQEHFQMLDEKLTHIMEQDLNNREKLKLVLLGFIEFGLDQQSHYEIMFLIKDEEVRNFINQEPMKAYEHFAKNVFLLCEEKPNLQEIWCLFIALHGFVSHYLRHVNGFEEVKELAAAHVEFLLKSIY